MMRFILVLFLFFPSILQAVEVVFPEVVLKGVETDFKVMGYSSDQLVVNGESIRLKVVGDYQVGKITLTDNLPHFENNEVEVVDFIVIPGWLSLLPPLIAIALALVFKEVLTSLFIGIFIGAATIGFYTSSVSGVFAAFLTVLDHYIVTALMDSGHLAVILFSITIGSIVAVISKNGGMQGVVNRLIKFATTRKKGMLTTYFLGLAIFFDDYANTLVVGNTMRSVSDRLKISREKLAYIVDSTAAPIAAIAFITTWIGAELTYISDGVGKIEAQGGVINESAYSIFVNSLAYSFYPIFTLFFVYMLIKSGKDFGPMRKAEQRALTDGVVVESEKLSELEEFEPVNQDKIRSFNAVIPIAFVIFGTFIGLLYTGWMATNEELIATGGLVQNSVWLSMESMPDEATTFFRKLGVLIGNADSYTALMWSSLIGLFAAVMLTVSQGIMKLRDTMDTVLFGIKTMIPAIAILVLAWSLAEVTVDLSTAEYLKTFFGRDFNQVWVLPALTFVLSAFIAFSTGSSWSTMALMYPLVIPLSYSLSIDAGGYDVMIIVYNTIASVLAGSVLGDHCSPISDTTILSSLATSCDHISHVRTQMPYALTVGGVALFVGVIPAAIGVSSFILIPLGVIVLALLIKFLGR